MRCATCHEDVDDSRAMGMDSLTREIVGPIADAMFHLRYVPGVLPPGPDVAESHVSPVICGPVEES